MFGILSQTSSGRGLAFFRVLAIALASGNIIFCAFFQFIYTEGKELLFDRLFFAAAFLVMFWYGWQPWAKSSVYSRWMALLMYANSAQIIFSIAYNNFNGFYLFTLLVAVQVFSYSFRDSRSTFFFLLYICVGSLAALFLFNDHPDISKGLYGGLILLMAILLYHSARVKCHFMKQMKLNQDLLRSLFSKSENAVFITDMNGSIQDVNIRVTELFGYTREEILNCDFKILRKSSLSEKELEVGLAELETSKYWSTEATLLKKSGEEFPARLTMALIRNATTQCLVYRVLDITTQKETESKLIEARDRAEEAVSAKGQFLAIMSHEIRTPLNGVIATASLLQNTPMNVEQEEYAGAIRRSGQSLLMLINDILEFSKMESGKMELDLRPEKVEEGIFDVTDLLRSHAESKNVLLDVNVASSVSGYSVVDLNKLRQVLFNLIGNAIKFTDHGKVAISVSCDRVSAEDGIIRFEIADTGIGIPEDKLHLLFKSFSQVDSSTSRRYGGTGLGLAISKQIVELMGGSIQVQSTYGKGTTFSFHFPCKLMSEDAYRANLKLGIEEFDYSDVRLLVAEDNDINKQVLKFILESLKVRHVFVKDGAEAVEVSRTSNFDMIFMDLNMPVMDGLTATRIIRERSGSQPVIVAISANNFREDINQCLETGMNDFLAKPFELEQLKDMFRKWLPAQVKRVNSAA